MLGVASWLQLPLSLFEPLIRYTIQSYGALIVLLVMNAYQLTIVLWLGVENLRRFTGGEDRTQAVLHTWQLHVPYVKGVSLLGPALGLLLSTLFSALGIIDMARGLSDKSGATLDEAVGSFMTEVGLSYVLLVVATIPLVTGVAALMLAQPIQGAADTKKETAVDVLKDIRSQLAAVMPRASGVETPKLEEED